MGQFTLLLSPDVPGSVRAVERQDALDVVGRESRHLGDVIAPLQLCAVAAEECGNVAAEPEEIHDVAEVVGMPEAQCMHIRYPLIT